MRILESISDTIKNSSVVKKYNNLSTGKKIGIGSGIGATVGAGAGTAAATNALKNLSLPSKASLKLASVTDGSVMPKIYGAAAGLGGAAGAIEGGFYAGGALLAKKAYDNYKKNKQSKNK